MIDATTALGRLGTNLALGLLAFPGSAVDALRDLLPDALTGGSATPEVDEKTMESYRTALQAIVEDDDEQALAAFRAVWNRREEIGATDDGLDVALRAGVGVAALVDLHGSGDLERVLPLIEPHWGRLDDPVASVFETLSSNYPDASEDDVPEVSDSPTGLDDLETAAFARLLDRLLNQEHGVDELYRASLQAMLGHRAQMAVRLQAEVWNRWDQESDDSPEEEVLGAGVALAAHFDFLGDLDLDVSRDEIVEAVEPHADRLSVAPAAVFEHLSTGSTDADPQTIHDEHVEEDPEEFDPEAADLDTLETIAHCNLLQTLRDRAE